MSANPPDKLRYRHEAIADMMLAHPMATQNEIAEMLGYTASWLSTVVNSDTFKAYFRERRSEWNTELAETAHTRALEVGIKALDKTEEALEAGEIDPVTVFEKALKSAGMGGSRGDGAQNNTQVNNYYTATPDELEAARARMRPDASSGTSSAGAAEATTPAIEGAGDEGRGDG